MNPRLPVVVALALAAAGCSSKAKSPEAAEQVPYVFPHTPHVENDVKCLECHAGIEKASRLEAGVRHVKLDPKGKVCQDCHGAEIATVKVPKRTRLVTLTFSHEDHVDQVDGKCQTCHVRLVEKGDLKAPPPSMSGCTGCHNHQQDFAEARCSPCHLDLKAYPLKPITAYAHQGDFKKTHGAQAKTSAGTCAACHDQTFCVDCHSPATAPAAPAIRWPEEVQREFIHRGDFVSRHMIEAGANPTSCTKCHGGAFCESCHAQQKVASPTSPFTTERDPHPTGWANDKASGHFHGDAARRNIVSCSGCHSTNAGQVCATCHRVGGAGGNPHPSGFLKKHDAEDQTKPMCRTCHG
jgi:hypothetical protein